MSLRVTISAGIESSMADSLSYFLLLHTEHAPRHCSFSSLSGNPSTELACLPCHLTCASHFGTAIRACTTSDSVWPPQLRSFVYFDFLASGREISLISVCPCSSSSNQFCGA